MRLRDEDIRELMIYAFRYTLGRSTYAPHTVIKILHDNWNFLTKSDKELYQREIREAIDHDMAGMSVDKNAWKTLLKKPI